MLVYKRALRRGMIGEDVRALQSALIQLGYNPNGVDGSFGNGCDIAVRQFQKDNRLVVDGSFGVASVSKVNELLGGKSTVPTSNIFNKKSKYYKIGDAHIIETSPSNIDIKILGNTLHGSKSWGVNGSFYNTPRPQLSSSAWSIATNNGKALGGNSMLVSYSRDIKRGTIVYYQDGTVEVLRVNSINEFKKPHRWSISGYSVYPYLNFSAEKMPGGIDYRTAHTYIGYKGNTIYLIVKPNHMIRDILPLVRQLGLDGCVVLDGGGSSQLNHPNGAYKSSRRINSAVILKEV